jgi:hypothetical protein
LHGTHRFAIALSLAPLLPTRTFTVSSNRRMTHIEMPIACAAGALLNLQVREGGPIISEGNAIVTHAVADGTFLVFEVVGHPKLGKRHTYAFVLAAFDTTNPATETCAIVPGPIGDSYADGRGWYRDPINGSAWLPLPDGAAASNEDLPFRITLR